MESVYDVVVVGYGCAGAAAAFEAASAGASVLVLDRSGAPGGTSALSTGELYLGGGTAVQRACGFEDSAEEMFTYLVGALGPHADEEKLRLYCDGSLEHFGWFLDRGLRFEPTMYDSPSWMPPTTDGLMWLGENAWPHSDRVRPVPRGHRPATQNWAGTTIMDTLVTACEGVGVEAAVDTRAVALVADEAGRVVGVHVRRFGEELAVTATRGVVLTSGGFIDNDAMLADHAPQLLGHEKVSGGYDDGSGISIALAIGAAVRRMSAFEVAWTAVPAIACRGLLVNGLGQRFVNEDAYPGAFSHAAFDQPGPCWVVIDESGLESVASHDSWGVRPSHVAESADELGEELGLPPGALAHTVSTYNTGVRAGGDPLFHKADRWLRELTGPLAAIDPRLGFAPGRPPVITTGFSCFTLGGLVTRPDGAVLRHDRTPIAGLYAAGRATSGVHGEGYVSGTSLGDGTFFGRLAGRSAAAGSS